MKNEKVIKILQHIELLLKEEKNQEAIDYIMKQKVKIIADDNLVSEYVDNLINNLK